MSTSYRGRGIDKRYFFVAVAIAFVLIFAVREYFLNVRTSEVRSDAPLLRLWIAIETHRKQLAMDHDDFDVDASYATMLSSNGQSWRVNLLKYYGLEELNDAFEHSQPWNSKGNRSLLEATGRIWPYSCRPVNEFPQPWSLRPWTEIVAFSGEGSAWELRRPRRTHNAILIVQFKDSGIHWAEPRDISIAQLRQLLSKNDDLTIKDVGIGPLVLFCDGVIWTLKPECPLATVIKCVDVTALESATREDLLSSYRKR